MSFSILPIRALLLVFNRAEVDAHFSEKNYMTFFVSVAHADKINVEFVYHS